MAKKQNGSSGWKIEYDTRAIKELKKLPNEIAKRIVKKISDVLILNPHSGESLQGKFKGFYRYRAGDYRVIYRLEENVVVILVLRIAHRKDSYRLPL